MRNLSAFLGPPRKKFKSSSKSASRSRVFKFSLAVTKDNPMVKKLPVIFIHIFWRDTVERIRIDLAKLTAQPKGRLFTRDLWKGEARIDVYRPRAAYHVDGRGTHVIELVYLKKDHPDLAEIGFWGKSTLTIPGSLTGAAANWVGYPTIEGLDGNSSKVKFRIEKPSEKRAEVVAVRKAQARFKQELLRLGSTCVLTGETLRALLDAAHIQSVEDGGPDEPDNGILLRADLHRLYDAGYFKIKTNGTLAIGKSIPDSYRTQLTGVKLQKDVIDRIKPYLGKRKIALAP
jgi:hypothetical protein